MENALRRIEKAVRSIENMEKHWKAVQALKGMDKNIEKKLKGIEKYLKAFEQA